MTERKEPIEPSLSWQELTPEEAEDAVIAGYSHFINNGLASLELVDFYDLDSEQIEMHESLIGSFQVDLRSLSSERIPSEEFKEEPVENVVRLAAQWLKRRIEKKIRGNLRLSPEEEDPAQVWFRQAEEFYSFEELSDEDRRSIENSLRRAMTIWENLEALADPERRIKPDAKLERDFREKKTFVFEEELTLPR